MGESLFSNLILTIGRSGVFKKFTLRPGQRFIIGRDADTDYQITKKSVSTKHLELLWTGEDLNLRDLDSSNGTFRMPQDSPFKEALFPLVTKGLVLRVAQVTLEFSWEPELGDSLEATAFDSQGTQLAKTVAAEKTVAQFSEQSRPAVPKKGQELAQVPLSPRAHTRPAPVQITEKHLEAATTLLLCGLSFLGLLVSIFLGSHAVGGIRFMPQAILRMGGMADVILLWTQVYRQQWQPLLGAALGLLLLGQIVAVISRSKKIDLSLSLSHFCAQMGFESAPSAQFFSALFFALIFCWPAVAGIYWGVKISSWPAAYQYWSIKENTHLSKSERIVKLRSLIGPLQGSSLLYKDLFEAERDRVLSECGGVGTLASWENKKVCLILITAVGIETLEDVRPALLGDVAARMAILLSLDGITRVMSTEGNQAPLLPFFLNSLEAAGLESEKSDISKLMKGEDASDVEETLRSLRHRIEVRLEARQRELRFPASLYLDIPGPLETGI